MTIPFTGFNATISVNDTVSTHAQQLFNTVTKIHLPVRKTDFIKTATLAQADNVFNKIPAMADEGQLVFELQYNAADLTRLYALRGLYYITGTTQVTFNVTTSDGTPKVYTIKGVVTEVDPGEFDNGSIPDTKVTVEVNAAITIA